MSTEKQSISVLIASEEVSAAEPWQPPDISKVVTDKFNVSDAMPVEKVELTRSEVAAIKKQAKQSGYQQGYQKGFATGKSDVEKQIQLLTQIIAAMRSPIDELDEVMEHNIVDILVEMVQQIIKTELHIDKQKILTILRKSLEALPFHNRNIDLYCNPDDAQVIATYLKDDDFAKLSCTIHPDPAIMSGGCRVDSGDASVTAYLEDRISEVIYRVLGVKLGNFSKTLTGDYCRDEGDVKESGEADNDS